MKIKFKIPITVEPDDLLGKPISKDGKRIGVVTCVRVATSGMKLEAEIEGEFSSKIIRENVPKLMNVNNYSIGCRK